MSMTSRTTPDEAGAGVVSWAESKEATLVYADVDKVEHVNDGLNRRVYVVASDLHPVDADVDVLFLSETSPLELLDHVKKNEVVKSYLQRAKPTAELPVVVPGGDCAARFILYTKPKDKLRQLSAWLDVAVACHARSVAFPRLTNASAEVMHLVQQLRAWMAKHPSALDRVLLFRAGSAEVSDTHKALYKFFPVASTTDDGAGAGMPDVRVESSLDSFNWVWPVCVDAASKQPLALLGLTDGGWTAFNRPLPQTPGSLPAHAAETVYDMAVGALGKLAWWTETLMAPKPQQVVELRPNMRIVNFGTVTREQRLQIAVAFYERRYPHVTTLDPKKTEVTHLRWLNLVKLHETVDAADPEKTDKLVVHAFSRTPIKPECVELVRATYPRIVDWLFQPVA